MRRVKLVCFIQRVPTLLFPHFSLGKWAPGLCSTPDNLSCWVDLTESVHSASPRLSLAHTGSSARINNGSACSETRKAGCPTLPLGDPASPQRKHREGNLLTHLNGVCLVLISFSLGGGWAFQQKDIFSFCQLQAFNFSLFDTLSIKNTLSSKPGFFLGADVIGGEAHLLWLSFIGNCL